ncbi:MAG: PAS domain S-box protein [Candidatus Aminicenantales bacterium]
MKDKIKSKEQYKKLMELHKQIVEMEKLEVEIKNKRIKTKDIESKIHDLFSKEKKTVVIVQDGFIKYANPRAAKLVGYPPEELVGKPFASYLHHEEIPKVTKLYQKRLAGEEIADIYQTRIYHKNGDIISIEVRASKINYHGKPADFVFIKRISKRKKR